MCPMIRILSDPWVQVLTPDSVEGMGDEQKRMEAKQDCTILWYKRSMLWFEMTKCSK